MPTVALDLVCSVLMCVWRTGGRAAAAALCLWHGNGANVIKVAPESGVRFLTFEALSQRIPRDPTSPTPSERFITGSLAGATGQVTIYPLEMVKTRLMVSPPGTYSGVLDCLTTIFRTEGAFALFRGLEASLIGIVPYAGTNLALYSTMKEQWQQRYPTTPPGALWVLAMGSSASMCAQVVSYPLTVARTRLQSQGLPGLGQEGTVLYEGAFHCLRVTLATEGVPGLYRGIIPNFYKAVPAAGLGFVVFENCRKLLKP